ncbi:HAD family hydrolase [Corynebacterium sp. A21]|uniref:HAD family hydrolase n=1 Tax=Corynebacterium sp. A21 TaxID=3457318 RepID=UPI003FD581CF
MIPQEEPTAFSGPRRVAAFFDLDKTVIATSSAHAFGKEFMHNGLISPSEAFELSMIKATYMFSGQSSSQMDSSRDQLAAMVTGWDVEQVKEIAAEALHHVVTPTIYAEARELIEKHRAAGHDVIIISASATMLVELIAAELGVEQVVATEMETAGGKFTGEISFYCKGPAKSAAMRRLAEENHYDLEASYAYSDSATDIPMLEVVGNPTAVNPDRQMKKKALKNGWDILSFRNPVPLFQPPSALELTIGSSVVAAAAATLGGLLWAMRTRRGTA